MKTNRALTSDRLYGSNIRETREKVGMSLRAVARAVRIHPTYLSKIELGQLPPPSRDVQERIHEVLTDAFRQLVERKKEHLETLKQSVFEDEMRLIEAIVRSYADDGRVRRDLCRRLEKIVKQLQSRDSK